MPDWVQFFGLTILVWVMLNVMTAISINLSPKNIRRADYAVLFSFFDGLIVSTGAYMFGLY